jgi:hypothetical protein
VVQVRFRWWNLVGNVASKQEGVRCPADYFSSVPLPVRYGCRQASSVCRCGLNIAAAGRGIGLAMLDPDPIPAYPNRGGTFAWRRGSETNTH